MRYLFIVFLMLSFKSISQDILLQRNGEQIPFKNLRIKDTHLEVVKESGGTTNVSYDSIVGYYDGQNQRLLYLKPAVRNDGSNSKNEVEFLERIVEGRINLYLKDEARVWGSGVSSIGFVPTGQTPLFLYTEKDGLYDNIYSGTHGRTEKEIIKNLLNDDPDIAQKVNSDDFKFNVKNIIAAITEYNFNRFQKPENNTANGKTFPVGLYTRVRKKIKESIIITVNDSMEYKMPDRFHLPIQLQQGAPSKVCVKSNEGSGCKLISAIPFPLYYELNFPGESVKFDQQTLSEFKRFILYTQKEN